MTDVNLSTSGPPETVLAPEPDDALEALRAALRSRVDGRRDAVADVCARWPQLPRRVGAARRARARRRRGVRVLPRRLSPRASTSCASRAGAAPATCAGITRRTAGSCGRSTGCGLGAEAIGEADEAQRCAEFLHQLDPGLGPAAAASSVRAAVKRALITGITGQDGRHLSQFLPAKGYQVFGLVHGQANPKIEHGPGREPGARARRGRPARPLVADRGRRAGAARRGLQPRRDQLRAALVQAGRAHRGDHRPRRAAHARSGAHRRRHREQPDPLLPGVVVGDVRQGARDAADRGARRSTRVRRTASPRCSATTRR